MLPIAGGDFGYGSGSRCLGLAEGLPGLASWPGVATGKSRRMIADHIEKCSTAGGEFRAIRRLVFALALGALCAQRPARKADGVSAGSAARLSTGMTMFTRRRFSLPKPSEARRSPKPISAICISMVSASPETMFSPASWLHQAAEQGEATGQFLLGLLFDKGYGVPQDWSSGRSLAQSCSGNHRRGKATGIFRARSRRGRSETDARSARRNPAPAHVCPETPIRQLGPAAPLAARY